MLSQKFELLQVWRTLVVQTQAAQTLAGGTLFRQTQVVQTLFG